MAKRKMLSDREITPSRVPTPSSLEGLEEEIKSAVPSVISGSYVALGVEGGVVAEAFLVVVDVVGHGQSFA